MKPSLSNVTEFTIAGIKSFVQVIFKKLTLWFYNFSGMMVSYLEESLERRKMLWCKESVATLCLFK